MAHTLQTYVYHTHTHTQHAGGIQEHKDEGLKNKQGKDKTVKQTKQYIERLNTKLHTNRETKRKKQTV